MFGTLYPATKNGSIISIRKFRGGHGFYTLAVLHLADEAVGDLALKTSSRLFI
jgi:hypothetical protein